MKGNDMDTFEFAGFSWPRSHNLLPRGSFAERLARKRNPVTGPYYHAPRPNAGTAFFYLGSDFQPGLRIAYADEVSRRIRHRGWYCDESHDQTIRGIVARLPHGRGFLAGWTMGEGMASELDTSCIWADETEAAHAADSAAELTADRQRDYEALYAALANDIGKGAFPCDWEAKRDDGTKR